MNITNSNQIIQTDLKQSNTSTEQMRIPNDSTQHDKTHLMLKMEQRSRAKLFFTLRVPIGQTLL